MIALSNTQMSEIYCGGVASVVDNVCIAVAAGSAVYGIIAVATSWNPIGWIVGSIDAGCAIWGIARGVQYLMQS